MIAANYFHNFTQTSSPLQFTLNPLTNFATSQNNNRKRFPRMKMIEYFIVSGEWRFYRDPVAIIWWNRIFSTSWNHRCKIFNITFWIPEHKKRKKTLTQDDFREMNVILLVATTILAVASSEPVSIIINSPIFL